MMSRFLLTSFLPLRFFFLFCCSFLWSGLHAQPGITSVIPSAVMPGDTVTINGNGFGTDISGIVVKHQSLQLSIVNVNETSIKAVVPAGTTFGRIQVIRNGLMAISNLPLTVGNYSMQPTDISASLFASGPTLTVGDTAMASAVGDFDNDGLIDLVLSSKSQNRLVVVKNTSTTAEVRFETVMTFSLADKAFVLETADLDADGRLDIVASNFSNSRVFVLKNTTQSGTISFANPMILNTGVFPSDIVTLDFDADGKLDLAVSNINSNFISLFRNTGNVAALTFEAFPINAGTGQVTLCSGDIDNDGKIDLVAVAPSELLVFKNNTSGTSPVFQMVERRSAANNVYESEIGDFTGDGRLDLAFTGSNGLTMFTNTGSGLPGSFFQYWKNTSINSIGFLSVGDFNADHLPDIATHYAGNSGAYYVVQSNMQQYPGTNYVKEWRTSQIARCVNSIDINKDGKADLIVTGNTPDVSVLINNLGGLVIADFQPRQAGRGGKVVIRGSGFQNVSQVLFGNTPADSFNVLSPQYIEAYPGTGASGNLKVISPQAFAEVNGFVFVEKPAISRFSPDTGYYNASVSIVGNHFQTLSDLTFGGIKAKSYQVINDTLITAVIDTANSGLIKVTTVGGIDSIAGFTYYPRPRIYSTSTFNPSPGSSISIQGKWLTGITSITLGSYTFSSFSLTGDSVIQLNMPDQLSSGALALITRYGRDSLPGFYNGVAGVYIDSAIAIPGKTLRVRIPGVANFPGSPDLFVNGTKALVTARGLDWLNIKVPFGSPLLSVEARVGGLHKRADKQNIVVSNLIPKEFGQQPFEKSLRLFTNTANPVFESGFIDIDGDQQSDILDLSGLVVGKLTIFRSRGIPGLLSFDTIVTNVPATASMKVMPMMADLDNNGLSDLILSVSGYGAYCFENQSTPGKINLVDRGIICSEVVEAVADLDGDGWQDLIALGVNGNGFTCYTNKSSQQLFKFAGGQSFNGYNLDRPVLVEDLDQDGKPEVLFRNSSFYKNTSLPGLLDFNYVGRVTNDPIESTMLLDLNADGSKEVLFFDRASNIFSVYRNSSAGAAYSFSPVLQLPISSDAFTWAAGDFNGDGRPDIALLYILAKQLILLKNTSNQSNVSFEFVPGIGLEDDAVAYGQVSNIGVADFDADGYPDLATRALNSATLRLYRNVVGGNSILNTCVGSPFSLTSTVTGNTYQWQVSTDSVNFSNLSDGPIYAGSNTLQLNVAGLASIAYGSIYRCLVDNVPQKGTQIRFRNIFTGAVDNDWLKPANWSCGTVPSGQVDVIVQKPLLINANVTVNSIYVMPGASVTVGQGYTITLLK